MLRVHCSVLVTCLFGLPLVLYVVCQRCVGVRALCWPSVSLFSIACLFLFILLLFFCYFLCCFVDAPCLQSLVFGALMRICSVFIFVCSVSVCLLLCSVCCLCFLCYALLVFCGLFLRTAPSHAFSFSHSSALSPLFLTFLSLFLCLFLSLCGLEIICSAVWWDTPSYLR